MYIDVTSVKPGGADELSGLYVFKGIHYADDDSLLSLTTINGAYDFVLLMDKEKAAGFIDRVYGYSARSLYKSGSSLKITGGPVFRIKKGARGFKPNNTDFYDYGLIFN